MGLTARDAGNDDVVTFVRTRDYKLVRELGSGACGTTVLLHDSDIDAHFVCKKYTPHSEGVRAELFAHFVKEVRLLHNVYHENLVRVYNHYLYPTRLTGYILMEYIEGLEIDDFVARNPDKVSDLFLQALQGFAYLERQGILHRDVRPGNLMVRSDGVLKIIDLGFGKHVETAGDFAKSISLNWWCEPPIDFDGNVYNFSTEVYFVGKLFDGLIRDHNIEGFAFPRILADMCKRDPSRRPTGFLEIATQIRSDQFPQLDFTDAELAAYRAFAEAVSKHITKLHEGAKFVDDPGKIIKDLGTVYRGMLLEQNVPDAATVTRCFVSGIYYYVKQGMPVAVVRDFLHLLRAASPEKARVIIANLNTRLAAIPRYSPTPPGSEDDVPF